MFRVPAWCDTWTLELTQPIAEESVDEDIEEEEEDDDGAVQLSFENWQKSHHISVGYEDESVISNACSQRHVVEWISAEQHFPNTLYKFIESCGSQLRVLEFADGIQCNSLGPDEIRILAGVLPKLSNLEQLKLHFYEVDGDDDPTPMQELVEALRRTPLKALYVHGEPEGGGHSLASFFPLAWDLRTTLVSFELCSAVPLEDSLTLYLKKIIEDSHPNILQTFRLPFTSLGHPTIDMFCSALSKMPHLQNVTIGVDEASNVASLRSQFSKMGRLREVSLALPEISEDEALHLIESLKELCLMHLYLQGGLEDWTNVLWRSGIVQLGWLKQIRLDFSPPSCDEIPKLLSDALRRNRTRHQSCSDSAAMLIALRKKKRCLTTIQFELVQKMAQYMFDLRNDASWDFEQRSPQNKRMKN